MSLAVVGLSHHTSDVALRERLAFSEESAINALHLLKKELGVGGAVILSTCNRVEIYAYHPDDLIDLRQLLRDFLGTCHGVSLEGYSHCLYEHEDREAVGHLFRVASSLDSLVVGESQILGQVHDAFLMALAEQATDKVISALFQKAFSVAKKVHSESNINAGKVSIGSVAVELAASIFSDLSACTVMVVGSGKMGTLALKSLVGKGVERVLVVNRSPLKAEAVAEEYRGEAIPFDDMDAHLHRADIIITSTAATEYILGPDQLQQALKRRNREPIFVIDIAVPRDVDPAVNELDNIYVYDIDDLKQVADQNLEARREEMTQCMKIVERGGDDFWRWMRSLAAEPTIVSMAKEIHAIRERELMKTLNAMPDLSEAQREEIIYLTKRIVNSILQRPMTQLKREVTQQDPSVVLTLVRRLFGIKENG
jgi:glutamyl-tRNA reductase